MKLEKLLIFNYKNMQPVSPFARTVIRKVTEEEFADMINSGKYFIMPFNLNCRPVTPIPDSYLINTPDGTVYEVKEYQSASAPTIHMPKKHRHKTYDANSDDDYESSFSRQKNEIKRLRRDIQITQNELMSLQDKYDANQEQYEKLKNKFNNFKEEYFRLTGRRLKIKELEY